MRRARRRLGQTGPLDKERAFQLLFRRKTYASVWDWLDRLGVPLHDRSDVAQEVFLAAHQSFHTYDPLRSRPERWLNKITVHIAAHYRDRALHRREELTAEDPSDVADEQPSADEQLSTEEERRELLELLDSVPPELRSVLIAHDIDDVPMTEIAAQRRIPVSTAYKWRARALNALAAVLSERRAQQEGAT